MTEAIDDRTVDMAELAAEFWKLLRNYERVVEAAPENQKAGLIAQARYGSRRLTTILDRSGMHVEMFDGVPFTTNLPVAAVNADDFTEGNPIVEQTLEPAIILGTTVVKTGRVFLRAEQA